MRRASFIQLAILSLLALGLPACSAGEEEQKSTLDFEIEIQRSSMTEAWVYSFTPDSVRARNPYNLLGNKKEFSRAMSQAERGKIAQILEKGEWKGLEKQYVDNYGPDDYPEFEFRIREGETVVKNYVYLVNVPPLAELAAVLDDILPGDFQIGYNRAYWEF